ncbi:MAG: glycosyltransferase family 39 protein [Saprospiraceae bacterium]
MQKLFSKSYRVLLFLGILAVLMRIFSFFNTVIDHDESTYIIIADALRHGQVYFRDVIDTKPIGIFILFGIFQAIFGKTILAIRIISSLWVALTGWMIYIAHRKLLEDATGKYNPAPIVSGIIYVILISFYDDYGLSPNTEVFFNLFTIMALILILSKDGHIYFFLSGLLLGVGFMIKYVVLFDAFALGIFYIWWQINKGKVWQFWLIRCILMGIGFLIPFFIDWIYYKQLGMEEEFIFYSFKLSGLYRMEPGFMAYLNYIMECFYHFLPVSICFFYCLFDWRKVETRISLLTSLWSLMVMAIILIPGRLFPHYFIQFMIPFSLLAGSFFDPRRSLNRFFSWLRKPVIFFSLLSILIVANIAVVKAKYFDTIDYPKEVADYLNPRLKEGDKIYTGNYHQIIYHLTGTSSPTPYIHNSLIWMEENNKALRINQSEELDKILAQNPRFILMRYPLKENNPLFKPLQTSYFLVKTFGNQVLVFERK